MGWALTDSTDLHGTTVQTRPAATSERRAMVNAPAGNMRAELVPIDLRWPGAWDQIEHWFENALVRSGANTNWSVEDLHQMGLMRQLTFWGIVLGDELIGAAAFQEVTFPQRRVLEIPFLGMNANTEEHWIPIFEEIKRNAKQAGFGAVVGGGRPGWARKLGGKVIYRCEFSLEGE